MKKGKIILGGGGDIDISVGIDKKYFSLLKNNSKILYIPIALNRTKTGFEASYDWFSTVIVKHSNQKDIDFTMLLEDDEIPDLKLYDSIYMGGGNTYKLLNYIKKSGLDEKIKTFIKNGGIVYGGSAGAIILGKDIRTVEEENDSNYSYYEGLNLLGGKSVICHYKEEADKNVYKTIKKTKSEVLALPEDSGMILDSEGKMEEKVGTIYIFNENNKSQL
ncbi:MAG TPA: Type 1 glutamine amidotransferase-like domain-containing protein [Patescibacteria group bacterium]